MANETIYPYGTNGQLPSSIGVINDLITGGADKALSAEMGNMLRKAIAGLLSELSPTAFTGSKPTESDLGISAPKFTITLPTDTRVDMTNQDTQVEAGDSYTNTFSLNETAEDGYVLRLSATMEGGGEISVDATTGVVSTNNVTGNITIAATVREVTTELVHSYLRTSSTDSNGRTCLVDQTGNGFNLYGNSNLSLIESGWYGNGRYDGINGGNLKIKENGSWTIHVKNYQLSDNGMVGYVSQQISICTNDARSNKNGYNVNHYPGTATMVSTGWGTGNSSTYGGKLYPTINEHEFGKTAFIKIGAANRKSFTFVFDSDASTISLYLEGVFIATESVSAPFRFAGISIKMQGSWDGVDFYNGALTAEDVAGLITT